MKLEVKIWFGIDEDAKGQNGWWVYKDREDVGNFDIIIPKTITITIPQDTKEDK